MREKRGLLERIAVSPEFENYAPQREFQHKSNQASKHRAGDWVCLLCNNHNYSFRETCNRCKAQTKEQNILQSLNFLQNQNQNHNQNQNTNMNSNNGYKKLVYNPSHFFVPYEDFEYQTPFAPSFQRIEAHRSHPEVEEPPMTFYPDPGLPFGEAGLSDDEESKEVLSEDDSKPFSLTQSRFWQNLNLDN